MADITREVAPDESEMAAGFSVQTLTYPDRYELPRLGSDTKSRLERAVALVVDDQNRIKRGRAIEGYIHEVFVNGEWVELQRFGSLDEAVNSEIYGVFKRNEAAQGLEPEVHE